MSYAKQVAGDMRWANEKGYGIIERLADAIEIGDGYVVVTLDPDGLTIVPATRLEDRVEMRQLSKRIRELRDRGIVASHQDGGGEQLPSPAKPSTSAP